MDELLNKGDYQKALSMLMDISAWRENADPEESRLLAMLDKPLRLVLNASNADHPAGLLDIATMTAAAAWAHQASENVTPEQRGQLAGLEIGIELTVTAEVTVLSEIEEKEAQEILVKDNYGSY